MKRTFVPVVATVTSSRLVDRSSGDTEGAYLNLVYEYEAGGKLRRYREPSYLVKKNTPEYEALLALVQSRPKNSTIPIHFNSRIPSEPVFDGIPARFWVPPAGVSVLLTCVGVGLLLLGFKMRKKPVWVYWARYEKRRKGRYEVFAAEASGQGTGWKIDFAVIWNLFVVLLVVIAIVDGPPRWTWQLVLFLLFFVSGGLFLFFKLVIANVLAGRAFGQPRLFADKMPLNPGDVFVARYTQRLKKHISPNAVVVSVRCYKDRELGRGTKSRPVLRTLHDDKKTIRLGSRDISNGWIDVKQALEIPEDALASTPYSNRYQVRWVLEFQVMVRDAFDFQAEFPIEVVAV